MNESISRVWDIISGRKVNFSIIQQNDTVKINNYIPIRYNKNIDLCFLYNISREECLNISKINKVRLLYRDCLDSSVIYFFDDIVKVLYETDSFDSHIFKNILSVLLSTDITKDDILIEEKRMNSLSGYAYRNKGVEFVPEWIRII